MQLIHNVVACIIRHTVAQVLVNVISEIHAALEFRPNRRQKYVGDIYIGARIQGLMSRGTRRNGVTESLGFKNKLPKKI